jgi:hypothetical protein
VFSLPTISHYGRPENTLKLSFSGVCDLYFSYKTLVAFQFEGKPLVVRQNDWKQTTGKHLNLIDDGAKKFRVSGEEFQRLFNIAMCGANL